MSQQHRWVEALARDLVGLPISHELFSERVVKPHATASFDPLAALMAADALGVETLLRSALVSQLRYTRPDPADFLAALHGFGAALRIHKPALASLFREPALAPGQGVGLAVEGRRRRRYSFRVSGRTVGERRVAWCGRTR